MNLIQPIDVTRLEPLSGILCSVIHWYACDCISDPETKDASTKYQVYIDKK